MPRLKILMSEGGIGWIPYMIERCEHIVRDHVYRRRGAAKYDPSVVQNERFAGTEDAKRFPMTPTELFRRHIYGCFIDDEYGCRHLEEIGLDNVLMETDYPHGDGTFPEFAGECPAADRRPAGGGAVQIDAGECPRPVRS
jgi:hypothetical protein